MAAESNTRSNGSVSPKKKKNDGIVHDVTHAIGTAGHAAMVAGGAIKRTLYENPTNRNKASNLDKWLKGGNYVKDPKTGKMPEITYGEIAHGIGKGLDAVKESVVSAARNTVTPIKYGLMPNNKGKKKK